MATPIASEGLCRMDFEFPGLIAGHAELFAENCVKLHEDEEIWLQAQARAKLMMSENHGAKDWKEKLQNYFEQLIELRREGKIPDWQSKVLRSELANSRKYFSKWIEEKERPSSLPR